MRGQGAFVLRANREDRGMAIFAIAQMESGLAPDLKAH
jgi:hypothetical protein